MELGEISNAVTKNLAKFAKDIVRDNTLGPVCGLLVLGSVVYAASRILEGRIGN